MSAAFAVPRHGGSEGLHGALVRRLPDFLLSSIFTVGTAMLINRLLNPSVQARRKHGTDVERLRQRFGVSASTTFSQLELQIAEQVVIDPARIEVKFESIGGQTELIRQLREAVLLPLLRPELLAHSKLLQPTKGILLHGPPGTGKTMLAKAVAKEAGCAFLNVSPSTMLSKWYGESQKRVAAIWSVAYKLEPAVVFVDEIDCMFRERSKQDHEATSSFQSEWMTQWDGLLTREATRVLVIGTTNRPLALDPAIRRRLARQFYVGLPTHEQRVGVLGLLLKSEHLAPELELDAIAQLTRGYSGSDLKELCRAAAMIPVREHLQSDPAAFSAPASRASARRESAPAAAPPQRPDGLRPMRLSDFRSALDLVPPTSVDRSNMFHDAVIDL